jgi:Ca-activated chloride channel family protein
MREPAVTRAGLYTTRALAVPLSGVSIDAEISSFCARVAVAQRYVNREPDPIEAVYLFPLDEGAAVCGFEAIVDGTLVVGEVKERDEAFRTYDEAMERGDGAFLLDEERPDVFQASIGNLPPGKEVLVRLTYVTELTVAEGGLRFSIPTTVSPRYAPAEDHRGVGRPDADTLNPPVQWRVPFGLNLGVRVAMPATISRIESPSHPVSVELDSNRATVTLSQREVALDRDFVLAVESAGLDAPYAWVERGEDGAHAIAVAFAPRFDDSSVPCDVAFLVDRSGSMGGTSIEEVRNALQLCLRSMIPGCTFNIVGFGSSIQPLFPSSRAYDDASLAEASAHVAALQADLGGTEILPALEFVLRESNQQGVRQVVVLTDGEVTNTDAVLALAHRHAGRVRIFTFGIGAGSSHHLVKALARAGGGASEFIYPGERIEPKVVRQFGRLLSPRVTDVRVNWGGLDVTQAPSAVAPVFAGGRLVLYAFVKGAWSDSRPATVRLTAASSSGPVAFDIEVDPSRESEGRTVATLAARARIRELEEGPEWTAARGSRQHERKASASRQEIIALSVRYGLMSRETSYVAVERREAPVLGDIKLRRVPIALTAGWGGVKDAAMPRLADMISMWSAHALAESAEMDGAHESTPISRLGVSDSRSQSVRSPRVMASQLDPQFLRARGGRAPRSTRASMPAPLYALIALQHADGSWDLTKDLAAVVGCELAELEAAVRRATGDVGEARRALATALALAWLDAHAGGDRDQWSRLAAKGRSWLSRVTARPADGADWVETGARLLATGTAT